LEWQQKMFDIVGKRFWFLLASAVIIIVGLVSVLVPGGLKLGIDFEGGISVTLGPKEGETLTLDQVQQKLRDLGYSEAAGGVQVLGEGDFFFRTRELDENEQQQLRSGLSQIGEVKDFEAISAVIASETVRRAAIAMGVATIAMLLYIAWAFRKVPNPFRYGTCAFIALLFSVLVVLGTFSFLGRTLGWEIDPMFIAAILAVIGYGVNDTIVVLDRLRENVAKGMATDFDTTVNFSLVQTLTRSLTTGMAALLTILAIYLFVGGPIRGLLMALFVGIVASTYASIFIASQLLVVWERGEWGRFLPKIRLPQRVRGGE